MNIRDTERIRHNTKIIATLGPGSNNVELLRDMIIAGGLNVIRFNFSHGDAEFHRANAEIVREAARQAKPCCWMPRGAERADANASASTTASCRMTSNPATYCCWTTACLP